MRPSILTKVTSVVVLLACDAVAVAAPGPWQPQGPEVTRNGQVEGMAVDPDPNSVIGGIRTVVPVPGARDQMLVGTINGGIWRTNNLLAGSPTWTSVTPNASSLSIGAIGFALTVPTRVYAGFGAHSSFQ